MGGTGRSGAAPPDDAGQIARSPLGGQLQSTGIPAPDAIDGIKQAPIEGTSMAYTWDKANADAPTKHNTQYFEMLGNRSIYHDDWVAATIPATLPSVVPHRPM